MSATGAERNSGGDLVEAFEAAWDEGSYGPANDRLMGLLETLLSSFDHRFDSAYRGDWRGRAWRLLAEEHTNNGFANISNARTWLWKSLEKTLSNAKLADSHLISEDAVKSGALKQWKEDFAVAEGESLLDRSLDFAGLETYLSAGSLARVVPGPSGRHTVWAVLAGLLLKLGWPPAVATASVRAVEERLQKVRAGNSASTNELSRELPADVAKGLRISLCRFVIDPRGFVVSVLEGMPAEEALLLPQVRKTLPGLVWKA